MAKNINKQMETIIKIVVVLILLPALITRENRPLGLFVEYDNDPVGLLNCAKVFIYKYKKKLTSCKRIIHIKHYLKIIIYFI